MAWAKLSSTARFNLATSGVIGFPLAELPARIEDLEINGASSYGYAPLQERLAKKTGAPGDCIVASIGTSMANFVALSVLIQRGDEVLLEQPTYPYLLEISQWLGADVRRFKRKENFDVDLDELARAIRPTTKLIVLANLHNPSSAFTHEETMRQIGELAARVGARVVVDEVYLEAIFDRPWRSAFFLGDNFIVTSSLTKAYGLSGLRCGWILAQPDLAQRMWDFVDLTYGIPAHPAERLSVIALDHLPHIAQRARDLLERNRILLNAFLIASDKYLEAAPSRFGTTAAPRLRNGDVENFCERLRTEFETTVVPGHYFEAPQHFRIGIGGPTDELEQGLERISTALASSQDRIKKSKESEFMIFLRAECARLRMNIPSPGAVRETIDFLSETFPNWNIETSPEEFAKLLIKRYPELRFEWSDPGVDGAGLEDEPATEKQIGYLKILGVPIPSSLGIRAASDLIEKWKDRATDAQKRRLNFYRLDYDPNISKDQATQLIDHYKAKHPESEGAYQEWKIKNGIS